MTIEAIDFLPAMQPPQSMQMGHPTAPGFQKWMTEQFSHVNDKLIDAEQQVQRLAVGDVDNLHQVMIALEDAKLSFQLAMQVRNRVLEAYQEVLRMQI